MMTSNHEQALALERQKESFFSGLALLSDSTQSPEKLVRLEQTLRTMPHLYHTISAAALCHPVENGFLAGFMPLHGLTSRKAGLVILATLFRLHPELLKYISLKALCAPINSALNSRGKMYTSFLGLTSNRTGITILENILKENQEASLTLPAELLYTPCESNYMPLHGLCSTPASLRVLDRLLESNEALLDNVPASAWCLPLSTGYFAGLSPLAFLFSNPDRTPFIEALWVRLPGLKEEITRHLLSPAPAESISALHGIAGSLSGKLFLRDSLTRFPELAANVTPDLLASHVSGSASLQTLLEMVHEGEEKTPEGKSRVGLEILEKVTPRRAVSPSPARLFLSKRGNEPDGSSDYLAKRPRLS